MRWSRLFADLESQLDALVSAEMDGEVAERTRIELSGVRLVDRLRAVEDHPIEVHCGAAGSFRGRVRGAGADWLLVVEPSAAEALVPIRAMTGIVGLGRAVAPQEQTVTAWHLGLRAALRGIARDRAPVRLSLVDGRTRTGTIDRVGADFLDLAEHSAGEPRRAAAVSAEIAVPLEAVAVVRRW